MKCINNFFCHSELGSGSMLSRFRIKSGMTRGFTLVELIMSLGILSILIGIMTTLFGQIIDTGLDSQSTSGIDQDSKFVIARLAYDMQRASDIVVPATPSATTSATLTIKINSVDYTYALDGASNLQLTNDLGANILNGATTQVSDLSFQRLGAGNATDTVQVKFRLTSRVNQVKGVETKSFQTTLGIQ